MALTDHPANGVNSSDVGQVPSKEKVPLPVCDTCKQQARSVDRFSKDQSILKWTKCDPDKDKGVGGPEAIACVSWVPLSSSHGGKVSVKHHGSQLR